MKWCGRFVCLFVCLFVCCLFVCLVVTWHNGDKRATGDLIVNHHCSVYVWQCGTYDYCWWDLSKYHSCTRFDATFHKKNLETLCWNCYVMGIGACLSKVAILSLLNLIHEEDIAEMFLWSWSLPWVKVRTGNSGIIEVVIDSWTS